MRQRILLATFVAWAVLVVAIACWRMLYDYHVGSFFRLAFHDMPILLVALVVVLSVEGFFLRQGQ